MLLRQIRKGEHERARASGGSTPSIRQGNKRILLLTVRRGCGRLGQRLTYGFVESPGEDKHEVLERGKQCLPST